MKRNIGQLAFALLALSPISGCGPFWVDPYITVKESQLNWVHINYYNATYKPIRRISVYLSGTGIVEVKKGSSHLVSDDFAKKYKEEGWSDVKSWRVPCDPKRLNDIFQNLVNFGLLDREKTGKKATRDPGGRFIAVKANLCAKTYSDNVNIFKADPDLAEQLYDVIKEFDIPTR